MQREQSSLTETRKEAQILKRVRGEHTVPLEGHNSSKQARRTPLHAEYAHGSEETSGRPQTDAESTQSSSLSERDHQGGV